MKAKYILENYDRIVKDIKNPKIIFSTDLAPFLKKFASKSYLIHQIDFSLSNNKIKYAAKKPIHNLHPRVAKLKFKVTEPNSELEQYIPTIVKELNISSNHTNWCWCAKNKNTLYLVQDCEIEDLTQEQRYFLYCYHILKKENYKIKKIDKERIYKLNSKIKSEEYIHQKQYALENLAQRLIKEINPEKVSKLYQFSDDYNKTDCLKITYIYVQKLQHFIEKEYKNYLNVNGHIPYDSTFVKEFEISKKLNEVKSILLKSNINDQILKLVYEPLLKIETLNIPGKLTYYEFNYCTKIIKELHKQIESDKLTEEAILDCLFDLNFNSLQLFKYLTNTFLQELEPLENNTQKIYSLFRILKIYNQKQSGNTVKYKKNLPPIKKQIIGWIEEEIEYLNRIVEQEANQLLALPLKKDEIKFLTIFSVAQLSFFVKILVETNIIDHKILADVIRFIAGNFKTKNTDTIAIESLRTKFHNVENSTKEVVNGKIIEMLKLTKD
jgi:hypothetical protein